MKAETLATMRVARKTRTIKRASSGQGWGNIRRYLHGELSKLGLAGKVVSVLVGSPTKIRCYGEPIKDGAIFNQLNITIGRQHIGYPTASEIRSWTSGYFVPASDFGNEDGQWIALVNIPIVESAFENAFAYPRQSLR
jgi:hypothetical protein